MILVLTTILSVAAFAPDHQSNAKRLTNPQTAAMCFKTGERTGGMNKICY